eukprot:5769663-Ditylum_brightwellii.AAC.1
MRSMKNPSKNQQGPTANATANKEEDAKVPSFSSQNYKETASSLKEEDDKEEENFEIISKQEATSATPLEK